MTLRNQGNSLHTADKKKVLLCEMYLRAEIKESEEDSFVLQVV